MLRRCARLARSLNDRLVLSRFGRATTASFTSASMHDSCGNGCAKVGVEADRGAPGAHQRGGRFRSLPVAASTTASPIVGKAGAVAALKLLSA